MSTEGSTRLVRADTRRVIPPDEVLFGTSSAMGAVRLRAQKICQTNIPVLICGEGGTGKEALARWIHEHSAFPDGQFVKVNCAAIPGMLMESELFGYEKGAFTGAQTTKPGRIELAHRGTLFLDDIADLDQTLQSKLLHVLQDGGFSRIGGQESMKVDARVICATNRDLENEISAGKFRSDLYYRINVVRINLPPLRERREDIPALAEYFRTQFQTEFKKECEALDKESVRYLQDLHWPGNIRELSNGVARYVLIGEENFLGQRTATRTTARTLDISHTKGPVPLKKIAKEAIRVMERNVILETLRANQWNRRKTAQVLKISYRALIYKISEAGLGRGKQETNG